MTCCSRRICSQSCSTQSVCSASSAWPPHLQIVGCGSGWAAGKGVEGAGPRLAAHLSRIWEAGSERVSRDTRKMYLNTRKGWHMARPEEVCSYRVCSASTLLLRIPQYYPSDGRHAHPSRSHRNSEFRGSHHPARGPKSSGAGLLRPPTIRSSK